MSESRSRIYLRPPISADQAAFVSSVAGSKQLHFPWVSPPASPKQFAAFLDRMVPPLNYCFLVCTRAREEPAGVINITNVVLGPFRSGYLEYYVFAGFERQGIMRKGLIAVVRHAFHKLKLHRLEANIQPANLASIALVRAGTPLEQCPDQLAVCLPQCVIALARSLFEFPPINDLDVCSAVTNQRLALQFCGDRAHRLSACPEHVSKQCLAEADLPGLEPISGYQEPSAHALFDAMVRITDCCLIAKSQAVSGKVLQQRRRALAPFDSPTKCAPRYTQQLARSLLHNLRKAPLDPKPNG
jgi:ribosomal-protein-alanine N-acetyltransferase